MKTCIECKKVLSKDKYTRCRKCANIFSSSFKKKSKNRCLDCRIILKSRQRKRCRSCASKHNWRNAEFRKYQTERMIGSNNPSWKNGATDLKYMIRNLSQYSEWRTRIFEADEYTCQECRRKGHMLHAHHVKEFHKILTDFLHEYSQFSPYEDKETLLRLAMVYTPFWEAEGQTLCEDCHKTVRKI